ncbi:hypothetical protein Pelo_17415 [Pelomyxa schiedti]|nr:hypothetical protein Pelo_17415 [Pelomyxa schiedti]
MMSYGTTEPPLRVYVDTYGLSSSSWLTQVQNNLSSMGFAMVKTKEEAEVIVRPVPEDVAPQQLVSVMGRGGQYSREEIEELCGLNTRVVVFIAPGCPEETLPEYSYQTRSIETHSLWQFIMSKRPPQPDFFSSLWTWFPFSCFS